MSIVKLSKSNLIGLEWTIKPKEIPEFIFESAKLESDLIWNSEYTNKNSLSGLPRTKENLYRDCLLGKLGEYFLMSVFDYIDDTEKYHDLISPTGIRTEVKTFRDINPKQYKIDKLISKLKKRKSDRNNWFKSTEVIIILYDRNTSIFKIHGVYDI